MDTDKTPPDDRLWDALARWEQLYQQGQDAPAEELCRDCPEILDQLKDRIWALKRTAWMTKPTADGADPELQDASDLTLPKSLGQYELLERIGTGGMGQVFKAIHRRLGRIVTVKFLPRSSSQPVWLRDEARTVAELSHPNIVMALDADEQEGISYLVMEYIDGTDLHRHVQENGPLPVKKTTNIILQAAKGLLHAHEKGIVHRDVKPANLFLGSDGTVKILDLGLAQIRAAQPTQAVGTPDFMAPELALDPSQADHRSDIYALGCTFWFLLMAKPLFEGSTVIQKILAHRERPIPSLRTARPDVSEALDAIFRKMVAKRPDDRFDSAEEVVIALSPLHPPKPMRPEDHLALEREVWELLKTSEQTKRTHIVASEQPSPMQESKPGSRLSDWLWGLLAFLIAVVPVAAWLGGWDRSRDTAPVATHITSEPGRVDDQAHDRRVAEAVLKRGGNVTITAQGGLAKVTEAAQLPAEPFRLREIDLISTQVEDADLESIQGLPDLSALRLNHTSISDQGFVHLQNLPALRLLEVVETRIADDGLKHLVNLPSVTWLTLQSTFVTDAGLPHLKALPNLRELRLSRLRLTDQGLVHLEGLTGLRLLELYETGVTDAGMTSVKKLKHLTWLNLVGTKLTDAGLAELKELEGLRNLSVARTKVTDEGVRDFQKARPFCTIRRD